MPLPWQLITWQSPLAPEECLARLLDAAGRQASSPLRVGVSVTGTAFNLMPRAGADGLLGMPYLYAFAGRSRHGTRIVGRICLDARLLGAVMLLLIGGSLLTAASMTTTGAAVFETRFGMILGVAAAVGLAVVTIRAALWTRHSEILVALVDRICEAERVDT